jgi:hypothetical protein
MHNNNIILTNLLNWKKYSLHAFKFVYFSIQNNVIKFVNDLRQVGGFSPGTKVSSTNKTDCHDITEILLKVALNTITLTLTLK